MESDENRRSVDRAHGAVTEPLVRSSTFAADASTLAERMEDGEGPVYSRLSNPTVDALEAHIAELAGAEDALATASGMAAIHVTLASLLGPGARVVVDPCTYGCTYSLLERFSDWGVAVAPCDTTDPDALARSVTPATDVVFVETPMNPTLGCVDLDHAAEIAHQAGARLVVDNTFATPIAQQPLEHGADLVVHSLTKGVNGHSDLLAGAVAGPADLLEEIAGWRKDAGPVLDPETAWQVLRGAKTLRVRVEEANRTTLDLVHRLHEHGIGARHPLWDTHPDVATARDQLQGLSVFTIDAGSRKAAMKVVDALEMFEPAVSLGGVESLVCHPASTTHAPMDDEARREAGITDGLVRFSVGIEPVEELWTDLEQALAGVEPAPEPGLRA